MVDTALHNGRHCIASLQLDHINALLLGISVHCLITLADCRWHKTQWQEWRDRSHSLTALLVTSLTTDYLQAIEATDASHWP